jgi:hypothetical protein
LASDTRDVGAGIPAGSIGNMIAGLTDSASRSQQIFETGFKPRHSFIEPALRYHCQPVWHDTPSCGSAYHNDMLEQTFANGVFPVVTATRQHV